MKTFTLWLVLTLILGGVALGEEQIVLYDSDSSFALEVPSLDSYIISYCDKQIIIDSKTIAKMTPEETAQLLQYITFMLVQYGPNTHFSPMGDKIGCEIAIKMLPEWLLQRE